MPIYLSYQAQVALLTNKESRISVEYFNFSNVFSSESALEIEKYTRINDHSINLLDNKQTSLGLIYSLGLIELKTLKAYIETNLASGSIKLSKSLTGTPIPFVQRNNGNFCLCIDYRRLNNLIIQNCYPLSLISKSLNYLGYANCFI